MRGGDQVPHDSGFRRGGQDFTHKAPPRSKNRPPRDFDRDAARRFRQHERDLESKRAEPDET